MTLGAIMKRFQHSVYEHYICPSGTGSDESSDRLMKISVYGQLGNKQSRGWYTCEGYFSVVAALQRAICFAFFFY